MNCPAAQFFRLRIAGGRKLTPLCHRSTLKESRLPRGNAVAAIVCGNVRAILYPVEKILRRQQKFFIRSEFFIRELPLKKFHTSG